MAKIKIESRDAIINLGCEEIDFFEVRRGVRSEDYIWCYLHDMPDVIYFRAEHAALINRQRVNRARAFGKYTRGLTRFDKVLNKQKSHRGSTGPGRGGGKNRREWGKTAVARGALFRVPRGGNLSPASPRSPSREAGRSREKAEMN